MTANAPLKDGPDPCISVHTTLQADSQAKQIETEINHPITHGASFSPSYVGGILQTQIEAESAVQLTETRSNDRPVDKAAEVGIDDDTHTRHEGCFLLYKQENKTALLFYKRTNKTSYDRAVIRQLRLVSMSTHTRHGSS